MNHDELRKAAEAATPGPWHLYEDASMVAADSNLFDDYCGWAYKTAALVKGNEGMHGEFRNPADAAYIALANPQTILALLDEHAALGETASELIRHLADRMIDCPRCDDLRERLTERVRV